VESSLPLFDRAIAIAESIDDPSAKVKTLAAIAIELAKAGQAQRSQQLFDRAERLARQIPSNAYSEPHYYSNLALRDVSIQLAQAGYTQRALQLVRSLSSNVRKAEALNEIGAALAATGQTDQAKQTLLDALQAARGITGSYAYESNGSCGNDKFAVMSKIAANLSAVSQLNSALQIARSISGCGSADGSTSQDYQAWAFLGILSHLSTVQDVRQTWQNAQSISSPVEKAATWEAIATRLVDLGEPAYATFIAQKLATEVPVPNFQSSPMWELQQFSARETALQTIAIALAQKQQFTAAMQVVQRMTDVMPASASTFNFSLRPMPKSAAMGEIAHQLAIAGQTSKAIDLAKTIPDPEAKALAWIAIASEVQTKGQTAEAARLLRDLPLPPPPAPDDYYYTSQMSHIAVALVTAGQSDRALQIARSFPDTNTQESLLADIAVRMAELNQIEPALNLAKPLTLPGLRATAFSQIAKQLANTGHLDQAFQILTTELMPSEWEKDEMLADVANRYAQLGQRSQALTTAEAITNIEIKARAMAAIAVP
jgi:tetratricopeptide (TPR) repeat protein